MHQDLDFQVHIQQGCHAASQVDYHCHVPELVWLLVISSAAYHLHLVTGYLRVNC